MSLTMYAWVVDQPGPIAAHPLVLVERPIPRAGPGQIVVRVEACGVCRTDLHLAEGDLAPRQPGVVPGHQIVGTVTEAPDPHPRFRVGERVGIAWLRSTCGTCRWCRAGSENLCPSSSYTGWDADGGFAEFAVVPAAYAYAVPSGLSPQDVAPLLCAGIIGYRALHRSNVPSGGRLGIYGFGSSAHITAQIALAQGAELYVVSRGSRNLALAEELGATWVGGPDATPPVPLDSAIVFAPAGSLVPVALEALGRGGTLVLAGIHMSEIPPLDYQRHLFLERDLRTVTSNTRVDGEQLLALAARLRIKAHVTTYSFEQVNEALGAIATGSLNGSAVIRMP